MKYAIFRITSLFLLLTAFSCQSLFEVDPRQSIDADGAISSPEAATAALNSVYARLRTVSSYGRDLVAIPELLADNAVNTGAGNRLVGQGINQPGAHIGNWQVSYYAINEANLIIDALPSVNMNAADRLALLGQAKFLRALFYFDLVKTYAYIPTAIYQPANRGGVPVNLVGIKSLDQMQDRARAPIAEVYQLIYNQLNEAIQDMDAGSKTRQAPHYATAGAARALFSRVALYNGDWQNAVRYSTEVIESGIAGFSTNASFVADWRRAVHPESIFEVFFAVPDNIGVNESLRATFTTRIENGSTTPVSHGNVVLSPALFALYSANDVRRQIILPGLGNNASRQEMTKFFSKAGANNLDHIPVLRMSEMYLNRAEANFRLGNTAAALEDLNRIRTRAGLTAVTLAGDALLEEIILQRRLELAFEGHRFFDLKRLGRDIEKNPAVPFTDFRILANIPAREVDANPLLEQNPGY